jgi:hypothetical protein
MSVKMARRAATHALLEMDRCDDASLEAAIEWTVRQLGALYDAKAKMAERRDSEGKAV